MERPFLTLPYRAPYDWAALLAFLSRRTINGVESVDGHTYRRTANIQSATAQHAGWIEVAPAVRGAALNVRMSESLADVVPVVARRLRALLDLDCDPRTVARALGSLAKDHPGLRVPGAFDGFELAVRAIVGQQITVAAARTLAGRFATRFGERIATPHDSLTTLFPPPESIARRRMATVARLGIISKRAESIIALARALERDELELNPCVEVKETMDRLRNLPGIGEWTAQYIAMRALAWRDAFPTKDFGVMKALGTTRTDQVKEISDAWRPWRAYAVMHLWKSLE